MYYLQCIIYSALFTVYYLQCIIYSVLFTVNYLQCIIYSALFTVYYLQYIIYNIYLIYLRSFSRHNFDRNKTVYEFHLDPSLWQHVTERTE